MAQDIRDMFKEDTLSGEKMPNNHEKRFLNKLDKAMPISSKPSFNWFYLAASIVVLLGLIGVYNYFQPENVGTTEIASTDVVKTKTLGDVSPGLKKVEDYYLASINLELSKMKPTPETKDLFDGYLKQLSELNKEYEYLSAELNESGPSELTINALIDNLKFRLTLLYRLREQIKNFNTSNDALSNASQSI
ncbi:hypothetical protein [uncultured Algibacter sp.]|uniref:hypothetical protein n=1 Tax=uncultured Algibacter sp. TaxID=298659 RepID=UPI00261D2E1E|nr:hypothetical protein [uncultured Algibacter sp.]